MGQRKLKNRDGSEARCIGCNRPSYTAYCDMCAPSSDRGGTATLFGSCASGGKRHNGVPLHIFAIRSIDKQ